VAGTRLRLAAKRNVKNFETSCQVRSVENIKEIPLRRSIGLCLVFGTALILSGWGVWTWLRHRPPAPVTGNEVTYICLETREVIEGPVQAVPAINPGTGRRTLVPAVYSNRTHEWVPAPSEEVLRRNRQSLSQDDGHSPLAFAPPEDPDDSDDVE
jgi:hypothetical protein